MSITKYAVLQRNYSQNSAFIVHSELRSYGPPCVIRHFDGPFLPLSTAKPYKH